MYKWIWNFLRITGNPERIRELKERANLDGRVFNFEAFVPVDRSDPQYQTKKGAEEFDLERWQNDHWGTEQNAKDARIKEEESDSIFYMFKSAVTIVLGYRVYAKHKNCQNSPAKVARALKKLYPDLDIDWSCQGPREWSNLDIEFDCYDENGGLLSTWEDPRLEFRNSVTMDRENAEKFKKLYDKDDEWKWFSLSMIIPEPDNDAEEWMDFSRQQRRSYLSREHIWKKNEYPVYDIGPALAAWRYENWGTPSEAMYAVYAEYDENEDCDDDLDDYDLWLLLQQRSLDGQLRHKMFFYTLSFPPLKIYRKMAADGLVFKAKWKSDAYGDWAHGEGQVVDGCFLYEVGPITGSEKWLIKKKDMFRLRNEDSCCCCDKVRIIVKNRKHLDQLLECVKDKIRKIFGSLDKQGYYGLFEIERKDFSIEEKDEVKKFKLNKPFDLNFLDVSRVTDMSGLFNEWSRGLSRGSNKIDFKLDISQWDVSNVTKMASMFDDCDNVDFGDLSKWDRSKVTDC